MVGLVLQVWFDRLGFVGYFGGFGLVGLVLQVWFGRFGLIVLTLLIKQTNCVFYAIKT